MMSYTVSRYVYSDTPSLVPLAPGGWDEAAVRAAGFDPEDEAVTTCELAEAWGGHPAGSVVVTGETVEGHPFAVVEIEDYTEERCEATGDLT